MPKFPTFPTLFDECKTVSISDLKKWGYLDPNQLKFCSINWSRADVSTGSIAIRTDTYSENPYLEVDYKANGNAIKYRIPLVAFPSNLGKGQIWYFRCPHTRKLCRKLYLVDNYFYHRTAFPECMYEKQTHSRKTRQFHRVFGKAFRVDDIYKEIYSKHFKSHYRGKPTKRYQKLNKLAEKLTFANL